MSHSLAYLVALLTVGLAVKLPEGGELLVASHTREALGVEHGSASLEETARDGLRAAGARLGVGIDCENKACFMMLLTCSELAHD